MTCDCIMDPMEICPRCASANLALRRELVEALEKYGSHLPECILFMLEAGEPTPGGGYQFKYAGKWYQSKPIDETPKCQCGFHNALDGKKQETICPSCHHAVIEPGTCADGNCKCGCFCG